MFTELEKKNVPALRFPEFKGEWESKQLADITTKVGSGSTPKGGEQVYQPMGITFIRSQNVTNSGLNLEDVRYISEQINDTMKGSVVKPNDVLLNITGASIGRVCTVPSNFSIGNVNQHVSIVRPKTSYSPYFLKSLLESYKGQKQIFESQTGSGREGLNFQSIRSFIFQFPVQAEQQKIADFLTAVDERIQKLSRKKELLEQYKKGVMQQIFSQQIRFKDDNGNNYPDWEEKRLGEVSDINKSDLELPESFIYIDLESVDKGVLLKEQVLSKNSAPSRAQRVLSQNDILFQMVRPYQMNNYFFTKKGDFVASTGYAQIKARLYPQFLYHYLHNDTFVKEVLLRCTGTSYPAINSSDLANVPVRYPKDEFEQKKIADYLSSIDNKIAFVNKELEQSQTFKKGLLQQMFV